VHFVGYQVAKARKFESDVLVRLLLEAAQQPRDKDADNNENVMFQHFVTEMLKQLDHTEDVPIATMLRLEWVYLPLLEHSERPAKVIMRELATNPELFVQMICAVYKPSDDSGITEAPPEDADLAHNIATQADRLLRLWNVIPGTAADGKIDESALKAWVKEARRLARAVGRVEVAEEKIGEVLSASPIDDDGVWPALAIRELMEDIQSSHLETGLLIGRRNRRGVTTRLPRDGGAQEQTLAQAYSDWSKATSFDWPRASAVLEKLAQSYEEDARWHDDQAERLDW
jgi:hypothetical protein